MESVPLTQKEMARLQVLSSLPSQPVTTEQAQRPSRKWSHATRGDCGRPTGRRGGRTHSRQPRAKACQCHAGQRDHQVVHLARTRCRGASHTHLGELLGEREGIEIGRSTLRRVLVGVGLASPGGGVHPRAGYVVSGCRRRGCRCNWTEAITGGWRTGGPRFTLLLEADNATGRMAGALFCREETTHDYFVLLGESGSDPHLHGLERTRARLS